MDEISAQEGVVRDHLSHAPPLVATKGNKSAPARPLVAYKKPVDPQEKRANENKSGNQVDEPNGRHQEHRAAPGDQERVMHVIASKRKHHHRQKDEPVRNPDRQFPDENPYRRRGGLRTMGFAPRKLTKLAHDGLLSTRLQNLITAPVCIHDVHGASQAGIEGVNGAQNLNRTFRIGYRSLQQSSFVCPALPFSITWPCVPGGGNHGLIILDLLVFDMYPVRQGATWSLVEPETLSFFRPGIRVPLLPVMHSQIAVPKFYAEFLNPFADVASQELSFNRTGCDASQRGKERGRWSIQLC